MSICMYVQQLEVVDNLSTSAEQQPCCQASKYALLCRASQKADTALLYKRLIPTLKWYIQKSLVTASLLHSTATAASVPVVLFLFHQDSCINTT